MWASIELCWWFWFTGWLYKNKIRKLSTVNEAIHIGEAIKKTDLLEFLQPREGDPPFVVLIKNSVRKHSVDNFNLENYQNDHFFKSLVGILKGFGYILTCGLIFIMGLLPLWWIFGLMICRLVRWRIAYVALFTSNFLKNYLLAFAYNKIGFCWWMTLFILSAVFMSYVLEIIMKNYGRAGKDHQ
jgi:hypothetical protein